MGKFARKTAHKKLLKEEKTKTKLKVSHKTILPKGQNITNTSFKVKKIVVQNQLKDNKEEIVSRNNLNVKELLSRLHHHNAPLRTNALSSLREIVDNYGNAILNTHLSVLIHAASNLVIDKEREVRSEATKLLASILGKATEEQLLELFEIIVKHLSCAMSHIDANIRSNSLEVLDILISKHPNLTAKHCQSSVLPAFLDLISTKSIDSERKLTVQYNDKMTTNMWRIKVLNRLYALLNAIANIHTEKKSTQENQEYAKRVKWENGKDTKTHLYGYTHDINQTLDLSKILLEKNKIQFESQSEIENYTKLLMPLLLDIFVEIVPPKSKNKKTAQLTKEATILLKLIANVILLLWKIFETSNSVDHLKSWFSSEFGNLIFERVIVGRFPYSLLDHVLTSSNKNKKEKSSSDIIGIISDDKLLNDQKCTYLNVILSHICLLMYKYFHDLKGMQIILQYVTNILPSCLQLDHESVVQLLDCADLLFSLNWKQDKLNFDTAHLVKVIRQLYDESSEKTDVHHIFITEKMFNYLYKIVSSDRKKITNYNELNSWLDSLPRLLTEKRISFHMVSCILNIARCNIPAFSLSLDGYIESILDNLPQIEIITDLKSQRIEGKKLIANLLYFVQTWDEDFIESLKKALSSNYFNHLNNYIKDIIECKLSVY